MVVVVRSIPHWDYDNAFGAVCGVRIFDGHPAVVVDDPRSVRNGIATPARTIWDPINRVLAHAAGGDMQNCMLVTLRIAHRCDVSRADERAAWVAWAPTGTDPQPGTPAFE